MSPEFQQDDITYSRIGTYYQLLTVRLYDGVYPCLVNARCRSVNSFPLPKHAVPPVKRFAGQPCDRLTGTSAKVRLPSQFPLYFWCFRSLIFLRLTLKPSTIPSAFTRRSATS